jgi:hypothetical protein
MAEPLDAITYVGPIQSTDVTRVHFQMGRWRRGATSKRQPGSPGAEAAAGSEKASTPDEDQTVGRNIDTRA